MLQNSVESLRKDVHQLEEDFQHLRHLMIQQGFDVESIPNYMFLMTSPVDLHQ
jgi:hypothetical protein